MPSDCPRYRSLAGIASLGSKVREFSVAGYHGPNDGGAGLWIAMSAQPDPVPGHWRKLGARWFALHAPGPVDPRALGARGDGVADDSKAIEDAIALAGDVLLSRGRYLVKNIAVTRPAAIRGQHGAVLAALDGEDASWANVLLHISCGGCVVENLSFEGPVADTIERDIGPWALLFIENRTAGYAPDLMADRDNVRFQRIKSVRVAQCSFRGGHHGCFATAIDDGHFENLTFEMTQGYGIAVMSGARRLMLRGIRVHGTINAEGIKIGFWRSEILAEQIVISDFIVTDCGLLSRMPNVKEGIDLFMGAVRSLLVTGGIIDNCSGGGIEVKTRHTGMAQDIYQHVLISDILIRNRCEQKGIALLWTAERFLDKLVNKSDGAGRMAIANVRIWYDIPDKANAELASQTAAIIVTSWSNVTLRGIDIEGAAVGFYLAPGGGSGDETLRDLTIQSCKVRKTRHGLYATTGTAEDVSVLDCDFETYERTLLFAGTNMLRFKAGHSRFVQAAAGHRAVNRHAVDTRRMSGAEFFDCVIKGEQMAFFAQHSDASTGTVSSNNKIIRCSLAIDEAAGTNFVRLDEGEGWLVANNQLEGGPLVEEVTVLPGKTATYAAVGNHHLQLARQTSAPNPVLQHADRLDAILRETLAARIEELGNDGSGAYGHYAAKLTQGRLLARHEEEIARFILARLPDVRHCLEIGSGLGTLPMLLAAYGLRASGIEVDGRRAATAAIALADCDAQFPGLADLCTLAHARFPAVAPPAGLAISGDFTCTMTPEAATLLLDALSAYPLLLLDTDRFITRRTTDEERLALVAQIRARGFCEPEQAFDLGSGGYYLLFGREPGDVTASPSPPLAG